EQVIGGKVYSVEAYRIAGRGKLPCDVCPNPIHHGHKVVADGFDSGAGNSGHGIDPVPNVALIRAGAKLDGVVHGNALDHGPLQAGSGNLILAGENFLNRPCLAAIAMMEGSHDARCTSLCGVGQRHRVVRAEPSPGLLHCAIPEWAGSEILDWNFARPWMPQR